MALGALSAAARAAKPHEQGVARPDVAVERTRITLLFATPPDKLLGFERAPRAAVDAARVNDLANPGP